VGVIFFIPFDDSARGKEAQGGKNRRARDGEEKDRKKDASLSSPQPSASPGPTQKEEGERKAKVTPQEGG